VAKYPPPGAHSEGRYWCFRCPRPLSLQRSPRRPRSRGRTRRTLPAPEARRHQAEAGQEKGRRDHEEVVEAAKSTTKTRTTRDEAVFLESDDYVITWAVGHLVQLAEPEEYDEKWKKWKMADLPIVPPDGFKLVPRDAKSKKQLKLIETLLKREDVDRIINACDAGREGELIFAYVYESVSGSRRPAPTRPAGRSASGSRR